MASSSATKYLLILSTTEKRSDARRLSKLLLEKKLAACVTVIPGVESHYVWKNKACMTREYLLLIKTRSRYFSKIQTFFQEHHPYECPEILGFSPEKIHEPYAQWIQSQTSASPSPKAKRD